MAAHSNLKCNLTYQFSPADSKFDEWKQMYEHTSRNIASACRILEGGAGSPEPLSNLLPWRTVLGQFLIRGRDLPRKALVNGIVSQICQGKLWS